MLKRIITSIVLSGISIMANAALPLTSGGKAEAEIIIDEKAHPSVKFAAEELQNFIEKISGAKLPVVNIPGTSKTKIFLGVPADSGLMKDLSVKYEDDLKKLSDNDGFAVRTDGNNIYIFAANPKGVLNGVYNFLDRNSDIIWPRGLEPFNAIYSSNPNLEVKSSDYIDIPKFILRGWHICRYPKQSHEATELWMIRNRCNFIGTSNVPELLERRQKHGFIIEFGGGHNLNTYLLPPAKYAEEHPDFYAMLDGKRRPGGRSQLCFSNDKMTEEVIQVLKGKIKAAPDFVKTFNVMIEDSWDLCECPECKKAIRLKDGTLLNSDDEAFRSTQFFIFLNKVAEGVNKEYPDVRINSFGYFFTAVPPKIKLSPSINVRFCPYVKNDKERVENTPKWKKRTEEWVNITPNIIWREYYGDASDFPRPLSDIVAKDLQYINKLGVKRVFSEYYPDAEHMNTRYKKLSAENWDASGMQFWIISQLYWNPEQDLDMLKEKYLGRTYHEAASAMGEYRRLIHDAWYNDPAPSHWNDDAAKSAGHYILGKGLEEQCRTALEKAAQATRDSKIKELIGRERKYFEKLMEDAKKCRTPSLQVPYLKTDARPGFDFEKGVWSKASKIDDFKIMGSSDKEAQFKTVMNFFHDRKYLYIGIKCFDPDAKSLYSLPAGQKRDTWPKGDHVELFFDGDNAGKSGYYHLAFDFNANIYDARSFDKKWDGNWELKTEILPDGWRSVIRIELASLGIDINKKNMFKGLFYRKKNTPNEHSSWDGGTVHATVSFGDITLNFE